MKQLPFDLSPLSGADIGTVRQEDLPDIADLALDPALPQEERLAFLINALGNPYCFRFGDLCVKMEFPENGPPLWDLLLDYFCSERNCL